MNPPAVVEVTPPAVEPVLLGEAKLHLRVDHDSEDGIIDSKIRAARLHCERIHGRAYITRTYRLEMDCFPPGGTIRLPRPPTSEIVSIEYTDADGNPQTIDSADYETDLASTPCRIRPVAGLTWPGTADTFGAVRITFKAGYGEDPTDVPEDFRSAVKLALGDLYENRESIVLGLNANTTQAIGALLWPTRIFEGINES